MNPRSLERLELPKIFKRLLENCACDLGRGVVRGLLPETAHDEVRARLALTTEARHFTEAIRFPPLGGLTDVRAEVKAASIGSTLEAAQLLAVGRAASGARRLRETLVSAAEGRYPLLDDLAMDIMPRPDVERAVDGAIDDAGEIKDDASPALLKARRDTRSTQAQIQTRLRGMLADTRITPHLMDAFVTVRDGRYCLPVKAESRGSVPGIVHDRSSSGGTVFVEPQSIIDMNNRLRELAAEEREAIEAILRALSGVVGGAYEDLAVSLESCAQLDFAFAKAQLSLQTESTAPQIRDDVAGYFLKEARHPLVENCRANDIRLGDESAVTERGDFDVMMLTGPNTGGKTVVLKTLGLLAAMVSCGLHIPVADGSWLSIPREIHVDIGDEQSIEQSLSTFSGHLRNIVDIIKRVELNDLVLFDEIGAGTDPDEGAAMAKAVLRHLSRRGAKVVATTHYGELKHFALSAGRFENASVEFDATTLRPTYHLRIGVPGASNALDIAAKLGLPPELVARARKYLGRDRVDAEAATQRLEVTQRELQSQTEEARRGREEVEGVRREYEARLEAIEAQRQREIDKARLEARKLVDDAQREADEVLRELRVAARESGKSGENRSTEVARARLRTLRERVAATENSALRLSPKPLASAMPKGLSVPPGPKPITSRREVPVKPAEPEAPLMVRVGDMVRVSTLDREGEVLRVDGERIEVRVGAMKVDVKFSDLEAPKHKSARVDGVGAIQARKAWTVPKEIHLLGRNASEAVEELEKYLDDAVLAGMAEVRVVHGRGSGVLRTAIHRWLKGQRAVREFELAPQSEGGEGATVVRFA